MILPPPTRHVKAFTLLGRVGMSLDFILLSNLLAGRDRADVACPLCGPLCRTPSNRVRRVLRLWRMERAISFNCERCNVSGYSSDHRAREPSPAERAAWKRHVAEAREAERQERDRKRRAIDWIWQASMPVTGTLGEIYFREKRGITCPLPPAMRFIGPGKYPAAIVMPFLDVQGKLTGLHLTSLNPDGSKIEKKMLGATTGCPLVCTEPTGSHLGITEGLEDGLSLFQAVGIATWAAGSAGRMPSLAPRLPPWATELTIIADDDAAGQKGAAELKRRAMNGRREIAILSLAEA